MRPYEVMIIFDAGADPSAIQGIVDRVLEVIRTTGGNPGAVDRWGRRPFAYEVNHRREGYYVVIELTGLPQTLADLDRLLSLADEVVRHKVIRLPDHLAGHVGTTPTGSGHEGAKASEPSTAPARSAG